MIKQLKKKSIWIIAAVVSAMSAQAQRTSEGTADTTHAYTLDSVTVRSYIRNGNKGFMPEVERTYSFAGKKTEQISLTQTDVDIAGKIGRQAFAKVPGVFVYDMDGSGNQVNIAARGLDPHRGWEFNIRKDGIITNSDMYGYPASHYSMPFESIEKIELVRGTGSLQYGAQFGGMLNYVSKQGDTTRPFSFESINTVGSFNLVSTYNAVSGKWGKFKYYAYVYRKSKDGYRDVEHTESEAQNVAITYEPNSRLSIKAEWARSKYRYKIPGPLTDSMFHADPEQATRSRNYFSPDINIPSVVVNWQAGAQTRLQLMSSAVLGRRNSVMFDKPSNVRDSINAATLQYNNRQVDIDRFNSYTTELRVQQGYRLGRQMSMLTAGAQYMNNDLHRTQQGVGTTGSDYDLTLTAPGWGRDMHFRTKNLALFAENKFQLTKDFSISTGARIEMGETNLTGIISYYPAENVPVNVRHHYPLLGANFSYKAGKGMEAYGGIAQAYHPMLLKDLFPASLYEKVDSAIKDGRGYNAEIGFRGSWHFLKWDITGFLLQQKNRFGTLVTDQDSVFYTYRTNIGNSLTKGLEIFIQGDWLLDSKVGLSIFTSTAFMNAKYSKGEVKSGTINAAIDGKKVECAPDVITRNGITLRTGKASISALYSFTSKTYADALNTVAPSPAGSVGLVPSYGILDLNGTIRFSKKLEWRINVNNVANKHYFTKRPTFYPGPAIWPSDGRNYSASLAIKL